MPGTISRVAPYCDIEERMALVPPTAMIRGVWFKALRAAMERRGTLAQYVEAFPHAAEKLISFYPATEYLARLAVAGSLVTSPEKVHEGMFELSRGNAAYFAQSLIGRGLMRLLASDPRRLANQAVSSKKHVSTYGRWWLASQSDHHVEIAHADEYVWIESALLGAATGTFEAVGGTCTVDLKSRFEGSIFVRW